MLNTITNTLVSMTHGSAIALSPSFITRTNSYPMPGHWKMASVAISPAASAPKSIAACVVSGMRVAMTVHLGTDAGLDAAHRAVLDWYAERGHRLLGTRWEVYGPHRDDPSEVRTEVYWLLS